MVSLATIQKAEEGSDFHGLTQRLAYRLYDKRKPIEDNPNKNWSDAQKIISEASNIWGYIFTNASTYHDALEWTADSISREHNTDPETSWYLALDRWADNISGYSPEFTLNKKQVSLKQTQ